MLNRTRRGFRAWGGRGCRPWGRGVCRSRDAAGFSLIEVSLAILLIGVGVLTLFSLFPAGLKESQLSLEDTHVGLFADQVLSGIRAKAMEQTNWVNWATVPDFRDQVVNAVVLSTPKGPVNLIGDGASHMVSNMVADGVAVFYVLTINDVAAYPDLRSADLKVCFGNAYVPDKAVWFYSEYHYGGKP